MDPARSPIVHHAVIEEVLATWTAALGSDAPGYRGHVYRVLNFARALAPAPEAPALDDTLAVAAVFHDLGIWSDGTFDYLAPSIDRARAHLAAHPLPAVAASEVASMIDLHHKVTACPADATPLSEVFRRADLVDLSLGVVRFGLSPRFVNDVRASFPNAGFHRCLLRIGARWFARHPTRPLPMFRW